MLATLLVMLPVTVGGPGCRSVRPAANPRIADAGSRPSPPEFDWPARISNPPHRGHPDGRIPDHPDGIGVERADGSPITMEFVTMHPHGEVWAFGEDDAGVEFEFKFLEWWTAKKQQRTGRTSKSGWSADRRQQRE